MRPSLSAHIHPTLCGPSLLGTGNKIGFYIYALFFFLTKNDEVESKSKKRCLVKALFITNAVTEGQKKKRDCTK